MADQGWVIRSAPTGSGRFVIGRTTPGPVRVCCPDPENAVPAGCRCRLARNCY